MKSNIYILIVMVIRIYRKLISPLFPQSCIYTPTCSRYAETALTRYGAIRGGWLSVLRVLRCHPFKKGGHDPVPDKWENRK